VECTFKTHQLLLANIWICVIQFADIFVHFQQARGWLLSCSAHHPRELLLNISCNYFLISSAC